MAQESKTRFFTAAILIAIIVGLIAGMWLIDSYGESPGSNSAQPRDAADH